MPNGYDWPVSSPRLVVILGSGEIAPGSVALHRRAIAGLEQARGVILDTPFGFQENADELTERIQTYFRDRLGLRLDVATFRNATTATDLELEAFGAAVEAAEYVFAGPGSPSYAARNWAATPLAGLLGAKVRDGGVITFASAAAISLGALALPVYEIYKVGEAPHWIPGLDVLGAAGLRCAVVPHYDNAEGGTHDTRFCYVGGRRLAVLESLLPDDVFILGVDEHTAVFLDLDADTASVLGRGGMTIRHGAVERRFEKGESVALAELRSLGSVERHTAALAVRSLAVDEIAAEFDTALESGDVNAAVAGLLDLESRAHADTGDGDGEASRAALRRRLVRLGEWAGRGGGDLRGRVAPFVDALLVLRGSARAARRFDDADQVRRLLDDCGVEVRDTADGAEWRLHEAASGGA